jgi:hypothetical protein
MVGEAKGKKGIYIELRATLAPARAGTRLTNKGKLMSSVKVYKS